MNSIWCSMVMLVVTAALASADEGAPLEARFRQLGKGTEWKLVETQKVGFRTYHSQGMTAVGDRLFLSSVEVVDRGADRGIGHLFEMDRNGELLRETIVGEGAMYHPGGIDYDGTSVWVSVGAYRPDSASILYAVDPDTLKGREVFRFADHLGAVAHFPDRKQLVAVSWGSRRFYRWETVMQDGQWVVPDPEHPVMQPNGSHYVDYQDMQRISGTPFLLCSGLQGYSSSANRFPSLRLGGIDLINVDQLLAHHQIPVPVRPPAAPAWTQNPFYVEVTNEGLRFFFVPEDNESFIHVFEVETGK